MLKVKNWNDFQHYKDRSPPWIKLHKSLLDNFEYQCLPVASKAIAPMIWLLASENVEGIVSDDLSKIAFRLRMSISDVQNALEPLIHGGFLEPDSTMLAERLQDSTPETYKKDTETEGCKPSVSTVRDRQTVYPKPDDVDKNVWDEFVSHRKRKKAAITPLTMEGIYREVELAGWTLNDALREVVERNWQTFKAIWVERAKAEAKDKNIFEGAI